MRLGPELGKSQFAEATLHQRRLHSPRHCVLRRKTTLGDTLTDVAPRCVQNVAAQLMELDQICYVAGSVGDGDLNVQVYARDTEELVRLVNDVIGTIPGVARVRALIVPVGGGFAETTLGRMTPARSTVATSRGGSPTTGVSGIRPSPTWAGSRPV